MPSRQISNAYGGPNCAEVGWGLHLDRPTAQANAAVSADALPQLPARGDADAHAKNYSIMLAAE